MGPEGLSAAELREALNWSENQFRAVIIGECDELNLIVNYHKIDTASPVTGWPDLEIIGSDRIIYRELKTMTGVLSDAQRRIGSRLAAAGASWSVWRPIDWVAGIVTPRLVQLSIKSVQVIPKGEQQ